MWIQPLLTFYISYKLHAYDNCDRNMLHNQCFNNHIQLNILSHSLHDLRVCKINEYQFIILHFNEPVHYPYIIMTFASQVSDSFFSSPWEMRKTNQTLGKRRWWNMNMLCNYCLYYYIHINYAHFRCSPVVYLRFNKSAWLIKY